MKQDRLKRAQSISKKIISEYFSENLQDVAYEYGIITVTDVIITSELSYMDVYVSALKNEDTLAKSLAEYANNLQRVLAKKIDFVKVPKIRFRYDDSGKNSHDIYSQIQKLEK